MPAGLVTDVFQNPEKGESYLMHSCCGNGIGRHNFDRLLSAGGPSEQIQLELVQLCTTLIQHAHGLFQEHRKELIQFGWSVSSRQCARLGFQLL